MESLDSYFFTFGINVRTNNGFNLYRSYIEVLSTDPISATEVFINEFAVKYLQEPYKWEKRYDSIKFTRQTKERYTKGCYLKIVDPRSK